MDELQNLIITKIKDLNQVIGKAESFLAQAPEGSLRISRKKKNVQYYHRLDPSDPRGTYIRKADKNLPKNLAQKDYEKKMLAHAYLEKQNLEQLLKKYQPEENTLYTENGEVVRSKSEKILADKFKIMDIPYHYEKTSTHPLNMKIAEQYIAEYLE